MLLGAFFSATLRGWIISGGIMLRVTLPAALLLASVAPTQAADNPSFYVSIDNSLQFFDRDSQRQHIRDYCLYMRCAGPTDGKSGLEPEGICAGVMAKAARENGGNACAKARFKIDSGTSYWEPTKRSEQPPYRSIWQSGPYSHNIEPERYSGNERLVEFEVKDTKPGDRCAMELQHQQRVVWIETLDNCKAGLLRKLEISPDRYFLSGKVIRGDVTIAIPSLDFEVRHITVMALGDSIAAGEGLPHQFYQDNRRFWMFGQQGPGAWLERRCHRSFFNFSLMAMSIAAEAERTLAIDYFNYACSGAGLLMSEDQRAARADESKADACTQGNGGVLDSYSGFWCQRDMKKQASRFPPNSMDGNQQLAWLPPQIRDAKDTLAKLQSLKPGVTVRPDYLIIAIGGNDVLFGKLLFEALLKDGCEQTWTSRAANWFGIGPGDLCVKDAARKRLLKLPGELEQLESAVADLKPKVVLLVGYLDPTHDAKRETCGRNPDRIKPRLLGPGYLNQIGASVSADEAEDAYKHVLTPLNGVLKDFAESRSKSPTNWIYVDPNSTSNSATRGWCARPSWFTTYTESQVRQGDEGGTAHPNIYGQNSLSYTVRCHMAKLKTLAPENVCMDQQCNCTVSAPASVLKTD
jgi:lysophospholipase L1-like esterase